MKKLGLILQTQYINEGKSYIENSYQKIKAIHSEELLYVDWLDRPKTAHNTSSPTKSVGLHLQSAREKLI